MCANTDVTTSIVQAPFYSFWWTSSLMPPIIRRINSNRETINYMQNWHGFACYTGAVLRLLVDQLPGAADHPPRCGEHPRAPHPGPAGIRRGGRQAAAHVRNSLVTQFLRYIIIYT